MRKSLINKKELAAKSEAKYFYIMREKPVSEHQGETVEEFLARGGKINRIEKSSKSSPNRDENGKFIKVNAPVV